MSKTQTILKIQELSKIYALGKRNVTALSKVNLEVNQGEFVSIMGPSGSGKTTLLNVLGCLDKPSSGQIRIDGVDVAAMREKDLYKVRRDKIGFVFQAFNLLPYLTARENVELPMECTKLSAKDRKQRAHELLEVVGLSGREEHLPSKLSGGEQQRVTIARALANKPAILLADEPTGNLDSKNKQEIVKLLSDLCVNQKTTVVMVTHDSHVAARTQRLLFLKDGKILKERRPV
ncbi:MAG: ABC transporter ATP-binding protein [Candidatus Bathyarchaeia archaeon]|jgi:putative ABC transport system ATP-binding protein